ncbi:succinate dehydrogenase cytochrome b subunit [Devriesea agamarum]|uniref:succinate dehydrogenase cytochrome b subunit n=1 Tax=Devriesea agamarum TaxID=472569 RepID=UPI00071DB49A|nr:succinate dehydrogenase cytochrome b subunit [Devriesea agamarum]
MAAVTQDTAGSAKGRARLSNFACKTIMAITGLIFAAFVFVHMIGNLKVFLGPDDFNAYAHWLRAGLEPLLPYEALLWIMRVVLLLCLIAHVGCSVVLAARARKARGPHRRKNMGLRSFTARTMLVTGIVLLAFIIFHILDLTTGTHPFASSGFEHATTAQSYAYENLIASFQRPLPAAFYILAMVILAAHISHGIWTAAHDLGVTGQRTRQVALVVSGAVAVLVMIANASIPVFVLLGVLQ